MVTTKTPRTHKATSKDTVAFPRMRVERTLMDRIARLANRYAVKIHITDQARACLVAGIELEEHGGTEQMLEARMAAIQEQLEKKQAEQFATLGAELERKLLAMLDERNNRTKKGRGKT